MSCSAARVSSPWRKACRTPCGRSAAHRASIAATAFRRPSAISTPKPAADLTRRYEELCRHYGMTPTRNNPGIAHENGAIEGPHGHLKRAIAGRAADAGLADFADLAAYRGFIDEIVGRRNVRNAKRIDIERAELQALPDRRTVGLRGSQRPRHLLGRLHAAQGVLHRALAPDRPSAAGAPLSTTGSTCSSAAPTLLTLPRGRAHASGKHDQVVDYRHVIHALRRKPMALLNLVYRDQLFPREAYRRTFDALPDAPAGAAGLPHHGRSAGARP